MKATGIVHRVDDLGRGLIPKEIRRTRKIREGHLFLTTLTLFDLFLHGITGFMRRISGEQPIHNSSH